MFLSRRARLISRRFAAMVILPLPSGVKMLIASQLSLPHSSNCVLNEFFRKDDFMLVMGGLINDILRNNNVKIKRRVCKRTLVLFLLNTISALSRWILYALQTQLISVSISKVSIPSVAYSAFDVCVPSMDVWRPWLSCRSLRV
jgi:hypothetical protein